MTKDYGFNVSISSVVHGDGLIDFGIKVSDSNGLEYDDMLESIDPSNLTAIYDLVLGKCAKAMLDSKKKADEHVIDRTVSDKFLKKLDEQNQVIEDLYDQIDELSDRIKSYEIDNQILRMRNDELVNNKIKATVSEKPKQKEEMPAPVESYKPKKYSNKVNPNLDNLRGDSYKYLPPWFGPFFLR